MAGAAERRPFDAPLPRDVTGFAHAAAAGQLPVVPTTPPVLLPGPSANRAFKALLVRLVIVVLGLLIAVRIAAAVHRTWLTVLVIGLGFLGFGLVLRWLSVVGRHNFAEFERGYTTL